MDNTNEPRTETADNLLTRLTAAGGQLFAPVTAPHGTRHRSLLVSRQLVALLGVFGTAIQAVIWLMIAVIAGRLDSPWWLWTAFGAAILVGGLTLAHRLFPASPSATEPDRRPTEPTA